MTLTQSTLLCVLLVLVAFKQSYGQTKLSEEEMAKILTECSESSNFTSEQLEEKAKAKEELPEEGLCFMKCIGERTNVIENGQLNQAVIEAMKADGKISNSESCNTIAGATIETCQDMKQFTDCFSKPQ